MLLVLHNTKLVELCCAFGWIGKIDTWLCLFVEAEKNHSMDLFRASRFKKRLLTNALSGVPEAFPPTGMKHKH